MLSNLENIKYRSYEPKNEDEVRGYIDWEIQCAEQRILLVRKAKRWENALIKKMMQLME